MTAPSSVTDPHAAADPHAFGVQVPCEVTDHAGTPCPNPAPLRAFIIHPTKNSVEFSLRVCREHAKRLSLDGHNVPGVELYFPLGWGTAMVDAPVSPGVRPYKVRGRGARTMRDVLVLAASDAPVHFDTWAASQGIPGAAMPRPLPEPLIEDPPGWVTFPPDDDADAENMEVK